MKELTEYKELDAATFDNSRLPVENVAFWNSDFKDEKRIGTLTGVWHINDGLKFVKLGLTWYNRAAEIITRFPRDVPEGVPPLPDNKPFLAYTGLLSIGKLNKESSVILCKKEWVRFTDNFSSDWMFHAAIDVSTEWAKEYFPEIVEAMEYEPIRSGLIDNTNLKNKFVDIVGHKLGSRTYDLNWNPTDLLPEDVFGKESPSKKSLSIEPPDYEEWDKKENIYPYETSQSFEAGKVRGKREATRWKYKDIIDHYLFDQLESDEQRAIARTTWDAARELVGEK